MGTVSNERFTEILSSPTSTGFKSFADTYHAMAYHDRMRKDITVSAENAVELLAQIRVYLTTVGYLPYKSLRPWELDVNLYSELDQNEKWWGWEFETGYKSAAACGTVVGHVWDTWNNVCFDGEGEGSFISEITFAPTEVGKFSDRSASAYQFMQYLSDNRALTHRTDFDAVGTHLNFSTPAIRNSADFDLMSHIVSSLNNTIHKLPIDSTNPRLRLFGRNNIYGGCFDRGDSQLYTSNGESGMKWIECKLFRTTYTIEEYDQYVRTATGMMKCVDALEAAWPGTKNDTFYSTYISNFLEVVDDGAEPVLATAKELTGRGEGDYVSGQYIDDDDYDSDGCDCDECRRDREGYYDEGDSW